MKNPFTSAVLNSGSISIALVTILAPELTPTQKLFGLVT